MGCVAEQDMKAFTCVQMYGSADTVDSFGIVMTEDEMSSSRIHTRNLLLSEADATEISYVIADGSFNKWVFGPVGNLPGIKHGVSDLIIDAYRPNHAGADGHRCAL